MAEFTLPKNSKIRKGKAHPAPAGAKRTRSFKIYRYDPEAGQNPRYDTFEVDLDSGRWSDARSRSSPSRTRASPSRRSCREGFAALFDEHGWPQRPRLHHGDPRIQGEVRTPLPPRGCDRDLVPDFTHFYANMPRSAVAEDERRLRDRGLQAPEDRAKLDGLYECILCACCSTSCPSYWWNSDKFLGPAILLQAYRWLADSRDEAAGERLDALEDPFRLYRCHTIMNCANVCPKGLNPAKAIAEIKKMMVERRV